VIYTAHSAEDVWHGKEIQEGVYTCMVIYTTSSGDERYKFGKITLVR
jgi:hypothetical protein